MASMTASSFLSAPYPHRHEPCVRRPADDEHFSALAFKIATDPFVGTLTFIRIYSGTLDAGSYIYNTTKGKKEREKKL